MDERGVGQRVDADGSGVEIPLDEAGAAGARRRWVKRAAIATPIALTILGASSCSSDPPKKFSSVSVNLSSIERPPNAPDEVPGW